MPIILKTDQKFQRASPWLPFLSLGPTWASPWTLFVSHIFCQHFFFCRKNLEDCPGPVKNALAAPLNSTINRTIIVLPLKVKICLKEYKCTWKRVRKLLPFKLLYRKGKKEIKARKHLKKYPTWTSKDSTPHMPMCSHASCPLDYLQLSFSMAVLYTCCVFRDGMIFLHLRWWQYLMQIASVPYNRTYRDNPMFLWRNFLWSCVVHFGRV